MTRPTKYRRKLPEEENAAIKEELKTPYWGIQTRLAEKYGVSRNYIQRLKKELEEDSLMEDPWNMADEEELTYVTFVTAPPDDSGW